MKRKLVQAGNSLAVTLPTEVVHEFRLVKGQEVDVSVHPLTGAVVVRPGVKRYEDGEVTPEFTRRVKELIGSRARLHERLAK
jgi:antitoxin component of MazEF toxin-antitoxin module